MNAILSPPGEARQRPLSNGELSAELLRGIQLSRAQAMALTRLHFAFAGGNRRQAMEAMDRLHALDAEAERLAGRLPGPPPGDEELAAVTRHLADQKLAIAFEKLALASSISGPDMVSRAASTAEDVLILSQPVNEPNDLADGPAAELPPPFAAWPALPQVEPAEWRPSFPGPLRAVLALGLMAVVLALLAGWLLVAI